MTSSAQKAAGEIWRHRSISSNPQVHIDAYASIIQQAITEAVDAAVAPKDKRVKELEAALQALKHWSQLYIDGDLSLSDIEDAIEKATAALEAPHEP